MGRKDDCKTSSKNGIDWFPLETSFFGDFGGGMEQVECTYGIIGYAVVMKLMQKIYGDEGYYMRWNSRIALPFAKKVCDLDVKIVCDIVNTCIDEGIFDRGRFEQYGILTSAKIQENYRAGTRKRVDPQLQNDYRLIPHFWTDVGNTDSDVGNTDSDVRNEHSTVEYSNSTVQYSTDTNNIHNLFGDDDDRASADSGEPPFDVMFDFCRDLGMGDDRAEEFADTMTKNGFRDQSGAPVRDWRRVAETWMAMPVPRSIQAKRDAEGVELAFARMAAREKAEQSYDGEFWDKFKEG